LTVKPKCNNSQNPAHRRRKRIQPHPSHIHHHPTNTHSLNTSHSLPLHPTRAHRGPYPYCYPPHHPDPLQYTHHPTHYPCPTLQPTLPPCDPHPPSQLHLHLSHSCPPSHPPHPLPPHQPRRHHPFTDFIANTPFPPSGNPSHKTATLVKPTPMNTLKSISLMLPYTPPKTQSSTKPFPPPSKALLSNGSQPFHLTQSITLMPSHTCSQPISLAAAHIKLLQSLS